MKKLLLYFCVLTASLSATSQQELPPPYNTAEILPFADIGFYSNAGHLEAVIKKYRVKTIIEVGSFFGTSTRHMASLLPEDGIVYAIDHWQGSIEHQKGEGAWFPEVERLYEYFLSNTIQAGLAHKIVPLRMSSLEAATTLSLKADLY